MMKRNDELTVPFKRTVKLLRERGEDNDTIFAITCSAIETDEELNAYSDWLEAHPEADHDTLFEYALTEYGRIRIPK